MEDITKRWTIRHQGGNPKWFFTFMDEFTDFKDIMITCSNCGDYHSIYIPCPNGERAYQDDSSL